MLTKEEFDKACRELDGLVDKITEYEDVHYPTSLPGRWWVFKRYVEKIWYWFGLLLLYFVIIFSITFTIFIMSNSLK